MNKISRFFLFCSGVHQPLLEECPSEKNKFVGIGASVFFTGLFACIAATYTLMIVFNSYLIPIIIGLFWGLMIFNLDRYIISSIRKYESLKMNLWSIIPRLILACMLSLVIAKPLELKIFEQEITDEINLIRREITQQQTDSINQQLKNELQLIELKEDQLASELAVKTNKRDELVKMAQQEADGTGGSGKRNLGPIYEVKKANLQAYQHELSEFKEYHDRQFLKLQNQKDSLRNASAMVIENVQQPMANGPAAQLHALNRLSSRSSTIWWAVFFITLLFIIVESTPILLKTLTPRGPYDELLDRLEKSYLKRHKKSQLS